jgi:hypothetical protein
MPNCANIDWHKVVLASPARIAHHLCSHMQHSSYFKPSRTLRTRNASQPAPARQDGVFKKAKHHKNKSEAGRGPSADQQQLVAQPTTEDAPCQGAKTVASDSCSLCTHISCERVHTHSQCTSDTFLLHAIIHQSRPASCSHGPCMCTQPTTQSCTGISLKVQVCACRSGREQRGFAGSGRSAPCSPCRSSLG